MTVEVLTEAGDYGDSCCVEILMVKGPASLQIHKIHATAIGERPSPTRVDPDWGSIEVPLVGIAGVIRRVQRRRFGKWFHIGEFDFWPGSYFTADGFGINSRGTNNSLVCQ
jgi:hypothetical protein